MATCSQEIPPDQQVERLGGRLVRVRVVFGFLRRFSADNLRAKIRTSEGGGGPNF